VREQLYFQTGWNIFLQEKPIIQIITDSATECQLMNIVIITMNLCHHIIPVSKVQ
jgi:hypothetical protein